MGTEVSTKKKIEFNRNPRVRMREYRIVTQNADLCRAGLVETHGGTVPTQVGLLQLLLLGRHEKRKEGRNEEGKE